MQFLTNVEQRLVVDGEGAVRVLHHLIEREDRIVGGGDDVVVVVRENARGESTVKCLPEDIGVVVLQQSQNIGSQATAGASTQRMHQEKAL